MILDIVLIVLLLFSAVYGYKKGCIKIVSKIIAFIIAFILAYFLAKPAGMYLRNSSSFGDTLEKNIKNSVSEYISEDGKIQEESTNVISKSKQILGEKLIGDKEDIVESITSYIFIGLGFIMVFILAKIILWIVTLMLDGVFDLPILKTFNAMGGLVASVVLTILKVLILLSIINFISTMDFMSAFIKLIDNSVITKVLYDHNIIVNVILNKMI